VRCGIGLLGGQCLRMGDDVAVTGTRGGATAAGRPFMLPSLLRLDNRKPLHMISLFAPASGGTVSLF